MTPESPDDHFRQATKKVTVATPADADNSAVGVHTPGPWSVPHFAEPAVNCKCGYVLTDHLMGAVCTVHASGEGDDWQSHGDNPKFAEAVANARLIAAAPELLHVLQRILNNPEARIGGDIRACARAAIAKARAA